MYQQVTEKLRSNKTTLIDIPLCSVSGQGFFCPNALSEINIFMA